MLYVEQDVIRGSLNSSCGSGVALSGHGDRTSTRRTGRHQVKRCRLRGDAGLGRAVGYRSGDWPLQDGVSRFSITRAVKFKKNPWTKKLIEKEGALRLFGPPYGCRLVGFLQDKKRFLLFALIRNQPFAIEPVLNAWELAARRTKVHQNPGTHTA